MLRIFHNTTFDFIRWWRLAVGLTVAFIAIGAGSLALKGVNYSIEFTGGTLKQLAFQTPTDPGKIRSALDRGGFHDAEIQQFGTNRDFTLRVRGAQDVASQAAGAELVSKRVDSVLTSAFGASNVSVVRNYPDLSGDPVRVALWPRCCHSNGPRRLHHARVRQADAPRGASA